MDSLAIERYSIDLKLSGYEDWNDAGYLVKSGQNEIKINLNPVIFEKAALILNSIPAATIYIDDKKVLSNSDETIRDDISAGKHTVKFVHPEYGLKKIHG